VVTLWYEVDRELANGNTDQAGCVLTRFHYYDFLITKIPKHRFGI